MSTLPNHTLQPPTATPQLDPILRAILLCVQLRAQRRVLWLRHLWEAEGMDEQNSINIHGVVNHILSEKDTPEHAQNWYQETPHVHELNRQIDQLSDAIASDQQSRYARLAFLFDLNEAEQHVLQACLALAMRPDLERVFSYIQDHHQRGYVTLNLVAGLFDYPLGLTTASLHGLFAWEFVQIEKGGRGEPALLSADRSIIDWLCGQDRMDDLLIGHVRYVPPQKPLDSWPVQSTMVHIDHLLSQTPHQRIRVQVHGAEGSGRRTFAAHLAREMGHPLLAVDIDQVAPENRDRFYLRVQRFGYLGGYALAWVGKGGLEQKWVQRFAPVQLQFLIGHGDVPPPAQTGVVDLPAAIPPLSLADRQALWPTLLPISQSWAPQELDHLVHRYQITVGQLAQLRSKGLTQPDAVIEALRLGTRHRLGKLAQLLACPFGWDDLALSASLRQHLHDFVYEVQHREALWEHPKTSRLYPQGKGLMALFTGSPGTGKTMAAQVLAAALGLDLFRIDLSSVISKYIGETAKHLDQILTQARHMHAVLLFDEADSLFGKRTDVKDAHDRHANADTNYLLQAIEQYPGIAILASNKKSNIDNAFIRRLRYVLDFPKPGGPQRLQIWQRTLEAFTDDTHAQSLQRPLQTLAEQVEVTGAQIKNAMLSAAFSAKQVAQPIGMEHLLLGLERELIKEGRRISPELQKRILLQAKR